MQPGVGPKVPSRPGWDRVYYTLAILAVLTVALSLYQNHELTKVYVSQIEFIKRTIYRTGRLLEMRQASSAVEDPANYVIGLEDVKDGPEKMQLAHLTFNQLLASFLRELKASPDRDKITPWFKELNEVEPAMTEMVAEGEQMFSCLAEKRLDEAGQHRDRMHRKSSEIVSHLTTLQAFMLRSQQDRLEKDLATISSRGEMLDLIALLALFLVFGVAAYGVMLSRRVEAAGSEREQYEEALRKSNDELDMRVHERTTELTKANEALRAVIAERQRAEEALRSSENKYRVLFDDNPNPMWVYDLESFRFLEVNEAAIEHYGYTRAEFLEMTIMDIRPPEDLPSLTKSTAESRQGLEKDGTRRHRAKDGKNIEVEIISHTILFAERHAVLVLVNDITERKQVEEKLRRSEEQFRLITENVADFIVVLDLEGRGVYSSPSYKGLLVDPEKLEGTVSFNEIHPDDRDAIKKVFEETIRTGIGQRSEHRLLLKNGSVRYMESQGSVIRGEDGNATNVVVVSRDITRRKRVEETLRENEDRFRLVVQATNDAVWDWDLLTNLFWWNEGVTTLFGYGRDEAGPDATWWTEHIHPEDQERVISGIYEQIDGDGKSWSDEYRFRRKDDSYAYIFDRGYVIRDDGGKPLRIIGAKMDVSERKRAEKEITQLNEGLEQRVAERTAQLASVNETLEQRNLEVERMTRLKSQFLASMSHELRTPLNAIIGFADLLQDGTSGAINEKQKKFVKHVQLAGRHLLDLINDILDLSKIEAGQLIFQPENFSADGALPEVLSVIKPLAMKKHIEVRNEVGPGLNVYADRVRFKQIIYNLLSNAVKFTPEGGQVNVESLKIENFVRFSVTDTGVGIRPEDHEAIFEEFRQVGQATSGVTEGTGLGLAICKRLVVQQEGAIWVESGLGKGSRFSFTLPMGRSISRLTNAPLEAAPPRPAREKPLILVVDDEAASRELMVSYLSPENFQTETASSGEEGLARVRQLQPDAIILDILSQEEGRWATLCELKTNPATAHIPIIIVSVLDKKNEGFAQGASEYLVKPVSKETLVKKLFRHLPSQDANLSTVLVVDDHPNALNLINDALDLAGYSPFVARSGKEAQDALWRIRVDAILLDLMNPELDGVELLRRVKENPRLREIPVIVLTAKELTGMEAENLKRHSRAIIGKDAQWRQDLISQLDLALGKQLIRL